jgi:hypothetical protein
MGGLGSTRWGQHQRKQTVEACLTLDLRILLRERRRLRQARLEGTITWDRQNRAEASASCRFLLQIDRPHEGWLELNYSAGQEPIVCRIPLVRREAFGGRHDGFQWLGVCSGDHCGRHMRKVFCRPDVPYFRCAVCHDLTYVSRQTAHWDDRGDMAAAARVLGMPLPLWKAALRCYVGATPPLLPDRW